ncbi:fumarylacetoacetate hydrolase family protein [Aquibacillus salsiterrae]|uniref:Fumarylacetoacetate hydrolase family protein n=1 Tax=Aquibacillus salsiterrae TaxID=2950439 RepID=A0A9X4AG43_9BACI|nr:fumarylacetoacetate hydrolase family protein [Aquibacillus salsiterrae]MDC3416890.1 fumarylacetoacetate hydrolase family protein [Aquibacillus salsiterrae]
MKIVSYKTKGNEFSPYRIGFVLDDKVFDLQAVYKQMLLAKDEEDSAHAALGLLPDNPNDFFALGKLSLNRAEEAYAYALENESLTSFNRRDIVLGPPVPNPSKIICIGTNYKDHVLEMKSEIPDFPVLFSKFNNALIGPEDAIEKSPKTSKLDYEVEFAVVIGKKASGVKRDEALDYVAGYTIGNDISARDLQKRTPQWLQGKSLDRSTPIGPWIVTTKEIPDPSTIDVKASVNGEVRQNSNTKHLIFDVPFLIEFISELITLEPGDIILTGTPGGVAAGMESPQFLEEGDVVTLEIAGIGTLENKVIAKK